MSICTITVRGKLPMNFFRLFSVAFLVLALSGCGGDPPGTLYPLTVKTARGDASFMVELADDDKERAQGLMGRPALDNDKGMLFVFDKEQPLSFWMKDTLIPLDVIFIRNDKTVVSIYRRAQPHDPTPIKSEGPARAALEIKGGQADIQGIAVGDRIETKLF